MQQRIMCMKCLCEINSLPPRRPTAWRVRIEPLLVRIPCVMISYWILQKLRQCTTIELGDAIHDAIFVTYDLDVPFVCDDLSLEPRVNGSIIWRVGISTSISNRIEHRKIFDLVTIQRNRANRMGLYW